LVGWDLTVAQRERNHRNPKNNGCHACDQCPGRRPSLRGSVRLACTEPRRNGLQHLRDISHRLPAVGRIPGERDPDDRVQFSRGSCGRVDGGGLTLEDGRDQARLRRLVEGALAAQQFVKNDPEGVDIGARVRLFAIEPFRRQVMQRPDDRALGGDAHRLRCQIRERRVGGAPHRRQSEIEQLGTAGFRDEHVGRFQVTMDDPVAMGVIEGVRHLDRQPDELCKR
jgi:hypothetical protein